MGTALDIDDRLLTLAKKRALENGTSLRSVIESPLRRVLMESRTPSARFEGVTLRSP